MSLVGDILDPILGSDTSSQDEAAQKALEKAQAAYENTALPSLSIPSAIAYKLAGNYDPALINTPTQQSSAYNDISVDPRLMDDQMSAIQALRDVAAAGGLTSADKANLAQIQGTEAQADRGRREAIIQDMNARGMGSSGNNLLAQLTSSQAATDRQSMQDLGVAGQAQQNALSATQGAGNLANQMGQTQYNQQAQTAAANDAINRFNSQQMLSGNTANAEAKNAASQYNLSNAQNIANANVDNKNTENYNTAFNLPQQNFTNQMNKNAGIAGQGQALSNLYTQQGDRQAAKDSGYMNAIIQGGAIAASSGSKKQ